MKTYETSATVEEKGQVRVVGVPFEPGTRVEVTIKADRKWQRSVKGGGGGKGGAASGRFGQVAEHENGPLTEARRTL